MTYNTLCVSYEYSMCGSPSSVYDKYISSVLSLLLDVNPILYFSVPFGNHGCTKGTVDRALEYIVEEGINTNSVYPFRGSRKRCHYRSRKSSATLRSYQRVKRGREKDLQCAVATEGPIAAGIDASHNTFRVCQRAHKNLIVCFVFIRL